MSMPAQPFRGGARLVLGLILATCSLVAQAAGSAVAGNGQTDALTQSQQHVVQLSNQLQTLETKNAEDTRQLAQQDQQIARLKAALTGARGVASNAASTPVPATKSPAH